MTRVSRGGAPLTATLAFAAALATGIILAAIVALVTAAAPIRADRPVVVALFTSQGCATCPPADRLLTELGKTSPGRVVPLAYHVDYWNRLGWSDPFSKAEWSRRQEMYARAWRSERVYTPQAVVDGASDVT